MRFRNWFLAAPVCLAMVLVVALAEDKKKPLNLDTIKDVPPDPVVPETVDLAKKNFTVKLEDEVRVVIDPDFDLDDPDFETKNVRREKATASLDMVFVPGGEFLMGSPATEAGRNPNEGPQHTVKVRDFWMAKFETSWDVFDLWYRSGTLPRRDEADGKYQSRKGFESKVLPPDAITRPTNPYVSDDYGHGREGKPALCMSHHAAMVFCHWMRLKTKLPYRLPTEAEWEYACRAGRPGPYGFDAEKEKLADYAWYKDNSPTKERDLGTTHKQGSRKPNAFGLCDLHGNLSEWTLDAFDDKLYAARKAEPMKTLGFSKPTDVKWGHVVRGGAWCDPAEDLRSARRVVSEVSWMGEDPQFPRSVWWLTKMDNIGFRVVLPVDEYPELVGLKPMVPKKGR